MSYEHAAGRSETFNNTMQEILDLADKGLTEDPRTEVAYDSFHGKPLIMTSTYRYNQNDRPNDEPIIETMEFLDGFPEDSEAQLGSNLVRLSSEGTFSSSGNNDVFRRFIAVVSQDGQAWFDVVHFKKSEGKAPSLAPKRIYLSEKDPEFIPEEDYCIEDVLRFIQCALKITTKQRRRNKNSSKPNGETKAKRADPEEPTMNGT